MVRAVFCLACVAAISSVYVSSLPLKSTGTSYYNSSTDTACKDGYCGSTSYSYMTKVFQGLFHSADEIQMLDRLNNEALSTPVNKDDSSIQPVQPMSSSHTSAICCTTYIEHIANTTMVNIYGESFSIVHLSDATDPSYQYIPHASCLNAGICSGTCVTSGKILTLLIVDANQQLKFDLFEVPGYCSCKNFNNSV